MNNFSGIDKIFIMKILNYCSLIS